MFSFIPTPDEIWIFFLFPAVWALENKQNEDEKFFLLSFLKVFLL